MRVPLSVRMLAPVVCVSLLLLGVGLITAWYVQRLQSDAASILAQNVASIRAAEELEIGLRKVRSRVNTFRLTGERTYLDDIPGLREQTDHAIEDAVRLSSTEREQYLMQKVARGYERFFAECDLLSGDTGRHEEQWARVTDILNEEIVEPVHEYLEINSKLMNMSSEQNGQIASRMVIALLLLGTTGPVAGLLAGFGIARGVSRSIVLCSAVDRVAFQEAIRHAHGQFGKASELLGISRNTLRAKLRGLGLSVEKQVLTESARNPNES